VTADHQVHNDICWHAWVQASDTAEQGHYDIEVECHRREARPDL